MAEVTLSADLIRQAIELLEGSQWTYDAGEGLPASMYCKSCGMTNKGNSQWGYVEAPKEHKPDCKVQATIAALRMALGGTDAER